MKKRLLFSLMALPFWAFTQSIAINSNGLSADSSALLDISALDKGILLPRLNTIQIGSIKLPATALLVFNSDIRQFQVNTGTPSQPSWQNIISLTDTGLNNQFMSVSGNTIKKDGFFLGTLNEKPLNLGTAGVVRLFLDSAQTRIGINTTSPMASLHINATDALVLPSGTTAQRPVVPVVGMIRFNASLEKMEGYTSKGWVVF